MLSGINLVIASLAFVSFAAWLLRRRSRLQSTSLGLNRDSSAN